MNEIYVFRGFECWMRNSSTNIAKMRGIFSILSVFVEEQLNNITPNLHDSSGLGRSTRSKRHNSAQICLSSWPKF